jgi:hypothetical protein
MKVHQCDGHGKADLALVKSTTRREGLTFAEPELAAA